MSSRQSRARERARRRRMLVLPEDERANADERERVDEALAWGRALRGGNGDARRRALEAMLDAQANATGNLYDDYDEDD